jgi:hypothetical protein
MKEFAKFSRMSADKRVKKMTGVVNAMLLSKTAQTRMKEFGIEIDPKPMAVQARVLGPFSIKIGPAAKPLAVKGEQMSFANDIRDAGFIPRVEGKSQAVMKPQLSRWLVVYPKHLQQGSLSFAGLVRSLASKQGLCLFCGCWCDPRYISGVW